MATKKITELTELTSVADDDFIAIVDTSGATTKKISRQNFILGLNPAGSIISYAGSVAPTGWLICDGTAISRTTYATLYSIIGTTYGVGDGSTTFNLPNLKGRLVIGYDVSQTEFNTLSKTGGSKTASLAHSHTVNNAGNHAHGTDSQGFHGHSTGGANVTNSIADRVYTTAGAGTPGHYHDANGAGSHSHNVTTTGDHSHTTNSSLSSTSILQPYITLNYLIKI